MDVRWTRRAFLASPIAAPVAFASRGQTFPAQRVRFADEVTENEVLRLTGPDYSSLLPPSASRCSSSKGNFLIYSSDRTGSMQIFRMDVKNGSSRLLTESANLDTGSVLLSPDQRSVCFFDGPALKLLNLGNGRERDLAQTAGERAPGLSMSEDGLYAAYAARRGAATQIMLVSVAKGGERSIAEAPPDASLPLLRPKRDGVLYRTPDALWLASFDGTENRRLKIKGPPGETQWSPDGRTLLYLSGGELREHTPDTNADDLMAKTSQFVGFGPNADGTVFVGASGSKASPLILLLLRVTRREMALCEHRATNPTNVNPVFSPSSQRIYFQSDRTGKSIIYSMAVDRLVEET